MDWYFTRLGRLACGFGVVVWDAGCSGGVDEMLVNSVVLFYFFLCVHIFMFWVGGLLTCGGYFV